MPRTNTSCFLFFALLVAPPAWSAQPAARKPLPETAVLDRVDGRLLHVDANDTWLFELTMEVKTPHYQVPAGTRFVLLPSSTLGRLVADVNERVAPRYRLSARVTLYKGRNYLFPAYYLPLSKFKSDQGPEEQEQKIAPPTEPEMTIPPEILEELKKQRPPRAPGRSTEAQTTAAQAPPERMLADCVGRIESSQLSVPGCQTAGSNRPPPTENKLTGLVFIPYGLGWNVSSVRYELLPSAALEEASQKQAQANEPIRFNVAGLVAEFQGKKYLLLQRAVVVYNYGNFGR